GAALAWTSSLDGAIGTGGSFSRNDLAEGFHLISLTGTDPEGASSSTQVSITVRDFPPGVPVIRSPADGQVFAPGEAIVFEGSAQDPEDGELSGTRLVWRSTRDGLIGTGRSFGSAALADGSHGISLTATDSRGQSATATITLRIVNRPPENVVITSPADGATFAGGDLVQFQGSADDPEDGPLTGESLTWSSDLDGELGTGTSLTTDALSDGPHTISLVATDSRGARTTTTVGITVGPVFLETSALPDARAGVEYRAILAARGGTPPYRWSIAGGALPEGLALEATTGTLSGAPRVEGTASFAVRVVDTDGGSTLGDLELKVCGGVLDLDVGDVVVTTLPFGCGRVLDRAAARYRIGVMARDVSRGPEPLAGGLRLRLRAGTPGEGFAAPAREGVSGPTRAFSPRREAVPEATLSPKIEALARATERLHMRLREEELRRVPNAPSGTSPARLGPPFRLPGAPLRFQAATERTFWVFDPDQNRRIPVNATLRGSSGSVLYYEDDGVTTAGTRASDGEVQAVLDYYEAFGRPIIDDVFGGLGPEGTTNTFKGDDGTPLALPAADLDRNGGRLIVLQIRPALMREGAAAYVSGCDRYPRPEHLNAGPFYCTGSNEGEITYMNRPESDFYLGSVVHEAKHVSSLGYGIFAGRGFNPSWIEEGTAEIAKEKSSRDAAGIPDGVEASLEDVYRGGKVTRETYGMAVVHSRARAYLKARPLNALVGDPDPNPDGSTYYGASWLFHRFLVDAYSNGDEDAFLLSLNTGGAGVEHIEVVTGRTLSQLL
ncbi:MAG TPA: putative Ig domain-containing protein, partial [Longimicrobiales bacterium]|nr:putative Ig domain-containing protein [Longimicrobiales bacterium]